MNMQEAKTLLKKTLSADATIATGVQFKNLFLFQVFTSDPFEGNLDPFRSVDSQTGEVAEFSIFSGVDTNEILDLFENAQKES